MSVAVTDSEQSNPLFEDVKSANVSEAAIAKHAAIVDTGAVDEFGETALHHL